MVKWMDKWAFTFGVLNLIASEFILTSRPQYFWSWYLLMVPTMISMRIPKYKKQGFFYFLFDFTCEVHWGERFTTLGVHCYL